MISVQDMYLAYYAAQMSSRSIRRTLRSKKRVAGRRGAKNGNVQKKASSRRPVLKELKVKQIKKKCQKKKQESVVEPSVVTPRLERFPLLRMLRTYFTHETPTFEKYRLLGKELAMQLTKEERLSVKIDTMSSFAAKKQYIDVFAPPQSRWLFEDESKTEAHIPKLFSKLRQPFLRNTPAICDKDTFITRFNKLTCNILDGMDWKNVCVGGGIVLASLANYTNRPNPVFNDLDVELFILKDKFVETVRHIYSVLLKNTESKCHCIVTKDTVSFLSEYPYRHIHIPIKLYNNPLEIMLHYPVDCTALVYNGNTVYAIERSLQAITRRRNIIQHRLRTPGYEVEHYRYAQYGFCVTAPGFQRHLVSPEVISKDLFQTEGLGMLVHLEHQHTLKSRVKVLADLWTPMNQCFDVYSKDTFSILRILHYMAIGKIRLPREFVEDANRNETLEEAIAANPANIYLPWGPQWTLSRLKRHLDYRNTFSLNLTRIPLYTIGLVELQSMLEGNHTSVLDDTAIYPHYHFNVMNKAPLIPDEMWIKAAYVKEGGQHDVIHHLCDAVFRESLEDVKAITKKLGRNKIGIGSYPGKHGRSPLNYACLFGNYDIVKLLLKHGASCSEVDSTSGLYPIHFACMSGSLKVVKLLIEHGASPTARSKLLGKSLEDISNYYGTTDITNFLKGNELEELVVSRKPHIPIKIPSFETILEALEKKLEEEENYLIDSQGQSVLFYAVMLNDVEFMKNAVHLLTFRGMLTDDEMRVKKILSNCDIDSKNTSMQSVLYACRQLINKIEYDPKSASTHFNGLPSPQELANLKEIKSILQKLNIEETCLDFVFGEFVMEKTCRDRMETIAKILSAVIPVENDSEDVEGDDKDLQLKEHNVHSTHRSIPEPEEFLQELRHKGPRTPVKSPSRKDVSSIDFDEDESIFEVPIRNRIKSKEKSPLQLSSSKVGQATQPFRFESPTKVKELDDDSILDQLAEANNVVKALEISLKFHQDNTTLIQLALKHDPAVIGISMAEDIGSLEKSQVLKLISQQ